MPRFIRQDKAMMQTPRQLTRGSVVMPRTDVQQQPGTIDPSLGIFLLAAKGDGFQPWGIAPTYRDRQLRQFLAMGESFTLGALSTVVATNMGLSWVLDGPPALVARSQDVLQSADWGDGWEDFVGKMSMDYFTQDKAAFAELVRDVDDPRAPVVGLNHLDALRCLGRDSRVLMADGSPKSILDIVRTRDSGPVMALGADGELHPRAITAWYESNLGRRYWLRLRVKGARHIYGRREGLWLTNDHELLTADGWQRAEHLGLGTKIVTQYPTPNAKQTALLIGTLLGDASLDTSTRDRSGIQLIHAAKQAGWLELKRQGLAGFDWTRTRGSSMRQTGTKRTPGLADLQSAFYPEGKKVVPRDLVEQHFSPLMLAAWYADDGTLQQGRWGRPKSRFYTNNFSREDNDWLADLLTRHGYPATVRPKRYLQGPYAGRTYWHLFLGADATEHLFQTIAPYLPECLRYKLPSDAAPFWEELWQLGTAERWAAEVESLERGANAEQTASYCIDVEEDHNFVAGGMVVHNCWHTGNPETPVLYSDRLGKLHGLPWYSVITLNEIPAPHEVLYGLQICALSRILSICQIIRNINVLVDEKTGGRHTRTVHIISGVKKGEVESAMTMAQAAADQAGALRYIQPILVTTLDPKAEPKMISLALADLPDDFSTNMDTWYKWFMVAISMGLLRDYQDFAPLPGGGLGSSNQSQILHMKTRGKGPAIWQKKTEHRMNFSGILPQGVTFRYDENDIEEEQQRATMFSTFATAYSALIGAYVMDPEATRQHMVENRMISQDMADELNKRDPQPAVQPSTGQVAIDGQQADAGGGGASADSGDSRIQQKESSLATRAMTYELDPERTMVEDELTDTGRRALNRMGSAIRKRINRKSFPGVSLPGGGSQIIINVPPPDGEGLAAAFREALEEMPVPVVNVAPPEVYVEASAAPVVNVEAPVVNVTPPEVFVEAPAPQPAPVVNIAAAKAMRYKTSKEVIRDADDNIVRVVETHEPEE